MSLKYAFLEHIGGRSALNPDLEPPASLAEAVREHLLLLLNTRQGSISHLPEYGMPDLSDYYKGFPDSLVQLADALKGSIAKYEPRISDLKVVLASTSHTGFEAIFSINGILWGDSGEPEKVEFKTTVKGDGRTRIET